MGHVYKQVTPSSNDAVFRQIYETLVKHVDRIEREREGERENEKRKRIVLVTQTYPYLVGLTKATEIFWHVICVISRIEMTSLSHTICMQILCQIEFFVFVFVLK